MVRNPGGELAGHVYTEVPYVDVLQTASNPALPLTEYEYLEFGNPLQSLGDFETMLRLGPVTGLGSQGAPGVSVVCRSAENDSQVFAYESVKWMDALRGGGGKGTGGGAAKLLCISGGQGHFTRGAEKDIQRAEDFLLLGRNMLRIN
jgi:oligopeptidase B